MRRGGGRWIANRDVARNRPPRTPPHGIFPWFCLIEDGCVACLLAPSIQLIHLQPFRVTRSWRWKDTLNHRLSRATPEVRAEVQVVEEGLSFSFWEALTDDVWTVIAQLWAACAKTFQRLAVQKLLLSKDSAHIGAKRRPVYLSEIRVIVSNPRLRLRTTLISCPVIFYL